MDDIIAILAQAILHGGPFVSICFLLVFIFYILYDLITFKRKCEEKDKQMQDLLEQFVQSNKEMTEAVCDLKVVIAEIKGRLQK